MSYPLPALESSFTMPFTIQSQLSPWLNCKARLFMLAFKIGRIVVTGKFVVEIQEVWKIFTQ